MEESEKKDSRVLKRKYDDAIDFINLKVLHHDDTSSQTSTGTSQSASTSPELSKPTKYPYNGTNDHQGKNLPGTQSIDKSNSVTIHKKGMSSWIPSFSKGKNQTLRDSGERANRQFFFRKNGANNHPEPKHINTQSFLTKPKESAKESRVPPRKTKVEPKPNSTTKQAQVQKPSQATQEKKKSMFPIHRKKSEKKIPDKKAALIKPETTLQVPKTTKKPVPPKKETKKTWFSSNKSVPSTAPTKASTALQEELTPSATHAMSQDVAAKLKELVPDVKRDIIKQTGLYQDEWREQDFYPLIDPFAHVSILQNSETKEYRYLLIELPLTPQEKEHHHFIVDAMSTFSINANEIQQRGVEPVFEQKIDEIIRDYNLLIAPLSEQKLMYWLKREFLGFGKLEPLMNDASIEDISCDGSAVNLFIYHRRYGSIQSNIAFSDEEELSSFVMRLAQKCGKYISIANPMLDATMPDGSRIQMTLSTEVSTKGSTFTIRKFKENPLSPSDLVEFNTMSSEMMSYLWMAVQYGANALIAGGTASGKTSTLNAVSLFIPRESKIVSIEETREINLPHPNWIPGVTRTGFGGNMEGKLTGEIDLYDLMKAALRQRPEYIIVGEIRGKEAYVLFQAMATGHTTYSTVHADSTKSLIHRLEGEPINIPRIMLHSLDIVCIQTIARIKDKRVRRCKQIIEIIDIDPTTKEILTNEVFRWDPITDSFHYTGKSYFLDTIRQKTNQSSEKIVEEMKQRSQLLDWMVAKNIHDFDQVATLTAAYYESPNEVIGKLKG